MLSIRALVYATGHEFGKCMPILDKYFGMGFGVMHPSVTPLIFSCFGDIGIAIGKHFEKYLPNVMPMIQWPHCGFALISCKFRKCFKICRAAMGDLAHALGRNVKILFKDKAFYIDFLRVCLDSDDYKMSGRVKN
ncbi:hypothetical protein MKX03_035958 [Papaver bracteatum]|nr:hypothetical protein MKX03_035958 [Papaver bracteatum]